MTFTAGRPAVSHRGYTPKWRRAGHLLSSLVGFEYRGFDVGRQEYSCNMGIPNGYGPPAAPGSSKLAVHGSRGRSVPAKR